MSIKGFMAGLTVAAAVVATPMMASADDSAESTHGLNFSANVGFTTDYKFRGISQSDGAAIQGGFDVNHDSGLYAGIWGSNVDFPNPGSGSLELDWYGGWAGEFNGIGVDIGAIYYTYPDASDDAAEQNYVELYGGLSTSINDVELGVTFAYSPDYFGESGDFYYYGGDVSFPIVENLSFSAHVGQNEIDNEVAFGTPDYLDWNVGLTYTFLGFDLDIRYVDTDLSSGQCGGTNNCDASAVFSISRSF